MSKYKPPPKNLICVTISHTTYTALNTFYKLHHKQKPSSKSRPIRAVSKPQPDDTTVKLTMPKFVFDVIMLHSQPNETLDDIICRLASAQQHQRIARCAYPECGGECKECQ